MSLHLTNLHVWRIKLKTSMHAHLYFVMMSSDEPDSFPGSNSLLHGDFHTCIVIIIFNLCYEQWHHYRKGQQSSVGHLGVILLAVLSIINALSDYGENTFALLTVFFYNLLTLCVYFNDKPGA